MPARTVEVVGTVTGRDGRPTRIVIYRHERVKQDTYEVRWTRLDGVRDNMGGYTDLVKARATGEVVLAALRAGQEAPVGREFRSEIRTSPRESSLTVRDLATAWLDQHPGKQNTIEGHEVNLRLYVNVSLPLYVGERRTGKSINLGSLVAASLKTSDINVWKKALGEKENSRRPGTKISSSTVKSALVTVRAALSWGVEEKLLKENVAAGAPHTVFGARKPQWFHTPEEFHDCLQYAPEWSRLPLMTIAYLGLRFGELAGLRTADVDLATNQVFILHTLDKRGRASTAKTPSSEDWIPLHDTLASALRGHIQANPAHPDGLLFHGPRHQGPVQNSTLRMALRQALSGAGIERNITLHGLRHSIATWLTDNGVPLATVKDLLRHTDLRTTIGYVHTSHDTKVNAIKTLR